MAGQGNQFYSDEEAEEILRLAIGKTSQVGAVSRQNLEQSAAELGISPEALAEAELQVIERRSEVQDRQEFRQLQKSDYVASLWQSLTTIGVLFAINYFTLHQLSWSLIVALFLGLKLVLEGTSHLVPMSASYQEEFSKWKARKRNKEQKKLQPQNEVLDRLVLEHEKLGKIEAIRLLREETGMDLRAAKDEVDRYASQRPDLFA